MTGLVERLREESLSLQKVAWSRLDGGKECSISANLADEAAALIEELVDALEPFAQAADRVHENTNGVRLLDESSVGLLVVGDLRRARAALTKAQLSGDE